MRIRMLLLAGALLVLTSCGDTGDRGTGDRDPGDRDPGTRSSTAGPMPTSIPAAAGPVTTRYPVTVLDDGDGAELCLGGVAESLPPQCGGPRLVGWDWSEHRGDFEDVSGVRWGAFVVTGTFDGSDFTPTGVVPADEFTGSGDDEDPDLGTPCPEPPGGWRVLDAAKTTEQTMDATFARASRLPGYADAWMDQSRNPASGRDDGKGMNDPAYVTVNVRVTGDVAEAERALREVWGGALCVSKAVHTEEELLRIQRELEDLPGMLGSAPGRDVLDVGVVHDDGTLQAWVDATYGRGVVQISSALVPASG